MKLKLVVLADVLDVEGEKIGSVKFWKEYPFELLAPIQSATPGHVRISILDKSFVVPTEPYITIDGETVYLSMSGYSRDEKMASKFFALRRIPSTTEPTYTNPNLAALVKEGWFSPSYVAETGLIRIEEDSNG